MSLDAEFSYARYRFPPVIMQHAVGLVYFDLPSAAGTSKICSLNVALMFPNGTAWRMGIEFGQA